MPLDTAGFPETVFTEAEVWDIGHGGARLRVTDVTGNGVDTDANGNAVPITYYCNMTGMAAFPHCSLGGWSPKPRRADVKHTHTATVDTVVTEKSMKL